jgi:hypothetical protein
MGHLIPDVMELCNAVAPMYEQASRAVRVTLWNEKEMLKWIMCNSSLPHQCGTERWDSLWQKKLQNITLRNIKYCHNFMDGVLIDDWIYSILWYSVWLHFSLLHACTNTHTPFHCHCLVAASVADIPLPVGSWTAPSLRYQLLTAAAHNSWTPAVI